MKHCVLRSYKFFDVLGGEVQADYCWEMEDEGEQFKLTYKDDNMAECNSEMYLSRQPETLRKMAQALLEVAEELEHYDL